MAGCFTLSAVVWAVWSDRSSVQDEEEDEAVQMEVDGDESEKILVSKRTQEVRDASFGSAPPFLCVKQTRC